MYHDHVYRDVCQPLLKQRVSCSDWALPTAGHLRVSCTDAAVIGQICAGVEVAKARRLLTFFIDETELDCSSIQSMITTIENEHGQVKSIALNSILLLEKKTTEAAADATIRTFYAGASVRRQRCVRQSMIGILFCTFRKSAGTKHFS